MRTRPFVSSILFLFATALFVVAPVSAQSSQADGKLKIHVSPKQAYVFVDGKAIRDGNQTIDLTAGNHKVGVYNYGYLPKVQDVQIDANKTIVLNVSLQPSGDKVSGPFADIEFKGHPRAAVLLNGTTPDYFVGHVDEFDWDWIWHQRLMVKPGIYQVMVTQGGNTIWSGQVTAKAGEKTIVDLNHEGKLTTKNWKVGNTLGPQPRFEAGVASATVPIAPVTGELSAQSTQLGCGQTTNLDWKSADAVDTSISNVGAVSGNGERTVNPTKTTTYELIAKGPGGEYTKSVTVRVNATPVASLSLSRPEIHYHKIGDKVVQQDSTTLTWSASNANSVMVRPLGTEAMSGSRVLEPAPKQTATGPVNEDVNYTLTSANACGGTTTRTATLHIVGSIDPPPPIHLASVFYPTAYPTKKHPKVGLVASEQKTLARLANHFENYGQYDGKASLMIVSHADVRGSKKYNQRLTDRRAALIKNYLIAQGIAPDKIQTRAMGKDQQLPEKEVAKLQSADPDKPEKWMMHRTKATWLAYNRRSDILLEPEGQQSTEAYPNDASDARLLWQRTEPKLKAVETASKPPAGTQQTAAASSSGN
jgi:hypothetical protein